VCELANLSIRRHVYLPELLICFLFGLTSFGASVCQFVSGFESLVDGCFFCIRPTGLSKFGSLSHRVCSNAKFHLAPDATRNDPSCVAVVSPRAAHPGWPLPSVERSCDGRVVDGTVVIMDMSCICLIIVRC